jgi:hypothetical protein
MVEWYWQGKTKKLGEKPVPVPLCPPQIQHLLSRVRTRDSAVRGRRLTAWAIARPGHRWVFVSSRLGQLLKFVFRIWSVTICCVYLSSSVMLLWIRRLTFGFDKAGVTCWQVEQLTVHKEKSDMWSQSAFSLCYNRNKSLSLNSCLFVMHSVHVKVTMRSET